MPPIQLRLGYVHQFPHDPHASLGLQGLCLKRQQRRRPERQKPGGDHYLQQAEPARIVHLPTSERTLPALDTTTRPSRTESAKAMV